MRVAITGGTGFVGRHLARQLVAGGHEVVLVARGADRRDPSIRDTPGMTTSAAIKRVAAVVGRRPLMFRLPVCVHMLLARLFERLMVVPLVARAQVRILSESVIEPLPIADSLPEDLAPRLAFSRQQIQIGLPQPGPFGLSDLRIGSHVTRWRHYKEVAA
jgi:hypothetical protein